MHQQARSPLPYKTVQGRRPQRESRGGEATHREKKSSKAKRRTKTIPVTSCSADNNRKEEATLRSGAEVAGPHYPCRVRANRAATSPPISDSGKTNDIDVTPLLERQAAGREGLYVGLERTTEGKGYDMGGVTRITLTLPHTLRTVTERSGEPTTALSNSCALTLELVQQSLSDRCPPLLLQRTSRSSCTP